MERKYDTTFIIDGDLDQLQREAIIKRFSDDLESNNARIDRIVRWGMRTLAYQIKKKSRGYYVIFYYSADPSIIKIVERDLRLNESVLRYMTILFDGDHPSYIPDEGEPDMSGKKLPEVEIKEPEDSEIDTELSVDSDEETDAENVVVCEDNSDDTDSDETSEDDDADKEAE